MEALKPSILYIDDEPINLMLFKAMFNGRYNVKTIDSPVEGLNYIRNNKNIDIIFSDMRMPELNGVEFIREAVKLFPSAKYFILTGFDVTKEIEEALQEKIIEKYFQKPFDKEDLIDTIEKYSTQK